jgi:hypothetical protein
MRTTGTRHHEPVRLPVSDAGGGVLAGIDLNDNSALLDIMELDINLDIGDAGGDSAGPKRTS